MFKRFLFLGFVVFLFVGAIVPQPVAADHVYETHTLQYDQYLYYKIEWYNGGTLNVKVTKESYDPYFDLYFLTPTNYDDYVDGYQFSYISACSDEDTGYASRYCNVDVGTYYLVVDNRWFSGADPEGYSLTVTVDITTTDPSGNGGGGDGDPFYTSLACLIVGGIIVVVVIIVMVAAMKKRRARAAAPPPMAPPPSTGYPPTGAPAPPPSYVGAPPPQDLSREPPPPSPPPQQPTYSPPPSPPRQDVYSGPPRPSAPPPDLELPGMMGGTRGTLDETYKGKQKRPPQ